MKKLTLAQRALRPVLNFAVERWFPDGGFWGEAYFEPFRKFDTEKKAKVGYGAAMYLIYSVHGANSSKFTVDLGGVTYNGEAMGDWRVTVEKIQEPT